MSNSGLTILLILSLLSELSSSGVKLVKGFSIPLTILSTTFVAAGIFILLGHASGFALYPNRVFKNSGLFTRFLQYSSNANAMRNLSLRRELSIGCSLLG